MNGLNGMDVARRIREFDNNVEIIFTTSVLDYVCEGYEVNAYRYMLKPIEYNIFKNNMGKCIENIIKKKIVLRQYDKEKSAYMSLIEK